MIKKIFVLMKKIIFGILFIYGYNIIVFPLNLLIPMNFSNVLLVTFLGLPAILGLCLFSLFVF